MSATLVAVITYDPAPLAENVAVVLVELLNVAAGFELQVTPWLFTSFVTVAVNTIPCFTATPPRFGDKLTLGVLPPLVTVIVATPFLVPSAIDVAVSVTVAGLGTFAGAVYVTDFVVAFVSVPQAAPLHPVPLTLHVTPLFCVSFISVALNPCANPVGTDAVGGATATEITAAAAVTVTVAVPFFVVSAIAVAVTVTVAGFGTLTGALYVTLVVVTFVNVPQVLPLHPVPLTPHVTPLFCVSFVSIAEKFCVPPPACTLAVPGCTLTVIAGAVSVTVAPPLLVVSATDVAVTVTVAGFGTLGGALYVTLVVVTFVNVPQAAPLHPVPLKLHVTPLFCVSLVSIAEKFCVPPPACTLAVPGCTLTAIAGAVSVTVALDCFVESALATAVTVTVALLGIVAGAVYTPPAVIVPFVAFPPTILFTSHVTAVLLVLLTVAVNVCVAPNCTVAVVGAIWIVTPPPPPPPPLFTLEHPARAPHTNATAIANLSAACTLLTKRGISRVLLLVLLPSVGRYLASGTSVIGCIEGDNSLGNFNVSSAPAPPNIFPCSIGPGSQPVIRFMT